MHRWIARTLAAFALTAASPSFAARDFTPQSGTWVISQELDGKPGRGLAIDVQGNTFFMQVFGYEKNGDATFYTATGQMDGNQVTAPLMRYKGGRSFGSAARDAVEDSALGNVTVSFQNGLKGTVQFPGESAMVIERFLVQSAGAGVTALPLPQLMNGSRTVRLLALDAKGDVAYDWKADLFGSDGGSISLWLKQSRGGTADYYNTFEEMTCQKVGERSRLSCVAIPKPPYVVDGIAQVDPWVDRLEFELAGYDVAGVAHMGDKQSGVSLDITGYDLGAVLFSRSQRFEPPNVYVYPVFHQNYLDLNVAMNGACNVTCTKWENLNTLMPINGTWIVEDELTGKPGRGLALDIQGNTAILQVYNYRADQRPTFHMGSAPYLSKGADTFTTVASIPMDEYAGGRSIGGAQQSGQWRAHAGEAQLAFSYKKSEQGLDERMWWTLGQIQLPQEQPVRIRRVELEKPATFAEGLLGRWFIPALQKTVTLTRVQGGKAMSDDGLVACEFSTRREDADVDCGALGWPYPLKTPTMNRGGTMIRLHDRHGNAVGLGQLD